MTLTLADFVLAVLAGSGALMLLTAIASRVFHARHEKQSRRRRAVCRLCLHAWEDHDGGPTIACPACGTTNEGHG
jgi:rubrerythrin